MRKIGIRIGKKLAFMIFFVTLTIMCSVFANYPINKISANSKGKNSWSQDMVSFGDWNQLNGDLNFDPDADGGAYQYDIEIEDSIVANAWTPSGFNSRTGFWRYEATSSRFAGVYRAESLLHESEWEFMTKIYFNPVYQGSIYSAAAGISISVYNENYERMIEVRLNDGASSTNDHRIYGHAAWYDESGTEYLVIDSPRTFSDLDMNGVMYGIKVNSGGYYVYFPDILPGGTGWRFVTNELNARTRGTMTYIVLKWHKRYEAPVDAHIAEITFTTETNTSLTSENNTSGLNLIFINPELLLGTGLIVFLILGLSYYFVQRSNRGSPTQTHFSPRQPPPSQPPLSPKQSYTTFNPPSEQKFAKAAGFPFFCQVDNQQHPKTDTAYQCKQCSRYICSHCYTEMKQVGMRNCPMCEGTLFPV